MRPAINCPLPFGDLQIGGLQLTLAPLNGELFINCQLSCLDTIYNLLSDLDISTIAYIRPFLLCTNIKHPFLCNLRDGLYRQCSQSAIADVKQSAEIVENRGISPLRVVILCSN